MKQLYLALIFSLCLQFSFGQIGFVEHVVEGSGNIDLPIEILSIDIDGDGDMDIVSGSIGDDKLAWYENLDGQGTFGTQHVITTTADGVQAINAADMDGDNDLDIIAVSHNIDKVAWYENTDGLGAFGPEHIIVFNTTNATAQASVSVGDLDADGDMDVIVPFYGLDDKISWFENSNGLGTLWVEHVITSVVNTPNCTYSEDFDGDGDLDVLSVSSSDGKLAWYENTDGLGTFGPQRIIRQQFGLIEAIAADFDGDGDADVASSFSSSTNEIAWYRNTDGLGNFVMEQIVSIDVLYTPSLYAADVDGDTDLDLIVASQNDDRLIWYENTDGLGSFGSPQKISMNMDGPNSVVAAYIDGDTKIDIVAASKNDDKISWFANSGVVTNEINGALRIDTNSDGCTVDDLPATNLLIETTDGTNTLSTFSLNGGYFQLFPGQGTYTTSVIGNLPDYYTSNPASQSSTFLGTDSIETLNFCIEPSGTFNDLNIALYPSIDDPRPGFNTTYHLVYNNSGTTQLSGSVSFEFDAAKLQFLNATETVASQISNTLTFDFLNLNPFETRTIDLELNVFAPPTTNINDVLSSTATINAMAADETEDDNTITLQQTVIGSYDPNDITVLEGSEILIEDAEKYLHYIIRFQNTGTASAINVHVENVLDNQLDWTTLQLQSLSYAGRVEIVNRSEMTFIFDNINLADSTTDEPNSHGFIAYKIKPMDDVAVGDIINNTADIYFDFNPPIITNTASTEFVETLSIVEFDANQFTIYPNPTTSILNIKGYTLIDAISLIDINGRILNEFNFNNPSLTAQIEITDLESGIYFLNIKSNDSNTNKKIIKR